jgi:hypothetical protein
MPNTILPKKAGSENPLATGDVHYDQMANDSSIQQFPQGTTYGSFVQNNSQFGSTNAFASNTQHMPNKNYMNNNVQVVHNQGESIKNSGGAMQDGADVLVKNDNSDWINKKWRPAMGWVYMATCTADFVIFPILWSVLQSLSQGNVTSQWQPLTLQGAGLYHIAMGAVLGIAAYGRTKEKIEGATKN